MKTTDRHQLPPTPIRIPSNLKGWLKDEAAANQRSLNGEVIHRLEQSRTQQLSNQPQKGNQQ